MFINVSVVSCMLGATQTNNCFNFFSTVTYCIYGTFGGDFNLARFGFGHQT